MFQSIVGLDQYMYLYPDEAILQRKILGYVAAILPRAEILQPQSASYSLSQLLQPQSLTELNVE